MFDPKKLNETARSAAHEYATSEITRNRADVESLMRSKIETAFLAGYLAALAVIAGNN